MKNYTHTTCDDAQAVMAQLSYQPGDRVQVKDHTMKWQLGNFLEWDTVHQPLMAQVNVEGRDDTFYWSYIGRFRPQDIRHVNP